MPEGPEVKIITEWLDKYTKETFILDCADIYKKTSGFRCLIGYKIENVTCKGKQIFFHLTNGTDKYLNNRLAMEGKWTPTEEGHVRFWFKLSTTLGTFKYLYFCDTRNFGGLDMLDVNGYTQKLSKIGADLLSDVVTLPEYIVKIKSGRIKNKQICDFMMEQKYFSGIGNYLKAEILYLCKISPTRTLMSLSDNDIKKLFETSLNVIRESYAHGGLTIKSFWSPEGRKGMYPCRVYNREKDDLGNPIIKATYDDDRNTHWVPALQV